MRLARSARAISIRFANGVEVQVLKRGKTFLGLGQVRVQGVDLRAEERPILPAIASPDGWQVLNFELAKITERREAVELVLKPRLVLQPKMEWACHAMHQRVPLDDYSEAAWTEPGSELRLTIRADEGKLGDLDAVGFSYAYSWRSRERRVFQILDRATWEIGGKASGNTTIMRGAFQPPVVTFAKRSDTYSTRWYADDCTRNPYIFQFLPLYTQMQGFSFQYHKAGLLVTMRDTPSHVRSLFEKEAGSNVFLHYHQLCGDLAARFDAPAQRVLFVAGKADATARYNQWDALYRQVGAWAHAHYGVRHERAVSRGEMFSWVAVDIDKCTRYGMPMLAEAGVKMVYGPTVWQSEQSEHDGNVCQILDYAPAKRFGGDAGLKALCDAAHGHGMGVFLWVGSCVGHNSPFIHKNPEWFARMQNGQIDNDHYQIDLATWNERNPGLRKYLVDRMGKAKALGVDGVFRDSHFNMSTDKFHFHFGKGAAGGVTADRIEQAGASTGDTPGQIDSLHDASMDLMKEMQHELGFHYVVESTGLFGVAWGGPQHRDYRGYEWLFVDTYRGLDMGAIEAAGDAPEDVWFRSYANRVCCHVTYECEGEKGRLSRWFTPRMSAVMKAYNQVEGHMRGERTIFADDAGILWRDGDVQVLWAYRAQRLDLGGDSVVQDVIAGTEQATTWLAAVAGGVYRIRSRPGTANLAAAANPLTDAKNRVPLQPKA